MKNQHIAIATVIPPSVPEGLAVIYYNGEGKDMTAEVYDHFPEDRDYRVEVLEYAPSNMDDAIKTVWCWYSGVDWHLNYLVNDD